MHAIAKAAGFAVLAVLGSQSARADQLNLINNGSFEISIAGPGGVNTGYLTYSVGQTISGGWVVVGDPNGNVAITPDTESSLDGGASITLPAEDGHQWLDLTGTSDNGAATGISQTIATVAGASYTLSFWLSNIDYSTYPGTFSSTVVEVNNGPLITATNTQATGSALQWQNFVVSFIASGTSSSIAFIDNVPSAHGVNGIDNVSVTANATQPAPEPSSIAVLALGIAALAALRFRHRAKA